MRRIAGFVRNLPVGRRLGLGFGGVLLLLCAVLAVEFRSFLLLDQQAERITLRYVPIAAGADGLRVDVAKLHGAQTSYVLDGGVSRPAFEQQALQIQQDMADLGRKAGDGRSASLLAKMQSEIEAFLRIDATIAAAVQQHDQALAQSFVLGPGRLTVGYLDDDAQSLADFARQDQETATDLFGATERRAWLLLLCLGAAAIVLGALVAVAIARTIRRPLTKLESAARQAAHGDLDVVVESTSNDETGRLISAFNTMVSGLRQSVASSTFDTELRAALDMADTEDGALGVIGDAMRDLVPQNPAEFLVADNSKAHLRQAVITGPLERGPCCPVETPFGCAAVRSGQSAVFDSSDALGACPKLKDRASGAVSAACVPVTFMGRAVGVLHVVGENHQPPGPDALARLRSLAAQAGSRIGTVRAFDRSHLQASTDALTGLHNRRTLEAKAHDLQRHGLPYTVLMCDLDHFKSLNDKHGHDAGDRALRLFGGALRDSVRDVDVVARYGGEEFVVVLPAQSINGALAVAHRIRLRLAEALAAGGFAPFTVSMGASASSRDATFEEVLRQADKALYDAKAQGRDRVVIAEEASGGLGVDNGEPLTLSSFGTNRDSGMYAQMDTPDPVLDRGAGI
ncbi:MAG: diguanylate cyclase [Acidimicrobiales bacterium]